MRVDLRKFGLSDDPLRSRHVRIKALPVTDGCVAAESLHGRVPRRMFLDTGICPIAPDEGPK